MASKVISFRFDDDKLALLNQHRVKGESESQTAMRLLLGVLGIEGKKPSIQSVDIVDNIRTEIKESLANGDIKDAIANSYKAVMGQLNGLVMELEALKSRLEELQSIPLAPVPQSPINEQLTTDNGELLIVNYQLPDQETGNREEGTNEDVDLADSDFTSDTQSTITNDQHLLWDNKLMKNPIDSIRKQLRKKEIIKTAEEIKQAFLNAGFDGNNHQSLREDVIKFLSQE